MLCDMFWDSSVLYIGGFKCNDPDAECLIDAMFEILEQALALPEFYLVDNAVVKCVLRLAGAGIVACSFLLFKRRCALIAHSAAVS